ncbi:MAG: 50S ribosomal protein L3 [Candidatus Levybacteria bacterium RIFCSPHIGHO2_02_FULL_37_10]|nr:MAG: 50S ribosomal protein L3 [Candidatus Levybacteria bacterium RIFCSPHIGHO2_02_FULL_37_10]
MNSILAKKIEQGQAFLENGTRMPVTKLGVDGNIIIGHKTLARDKYSAVQLGFDKRAKARPAKSLKSVYNFIREVRMADADTLPAIGDVIRASEIFKPGDVINVTGISKGKGYAGGVKRHHFKGGPRTHGQSDRERAPGAIGTTTTPGRVYKGKRMAGRMGHDQVTVKNLQVIFVDDNSILIKGLVPGGRNTLLMLKKVGENKKFISLYADKVEEVKVETKEKGK